MASICQKQTKSIKESNTVSLFESDLVASEWMIELCQ